MPRPPGLKLSRAQVVMYLSLADGNRTHAAHLAGVARATFFRALRHYRVHFPRANVKLKPDDIRMARDLCALGLRPATVARHLGVSDDAVRKATTYETWRRVL